LNGKLFIQEGGGWMNPFHNDELFICSFRFKFLFKFSLFLLILALHLFILHQN